MSTIRIRHFHDNRGRLIATIATKDVDNLIAVGVTRCRPTDKPLRSFGRQHAVGRLHDLLSGSISKDGIERGEGFYISSENLKLMIKDNPFTSRRGFNKKILADYATTTKAF